MITLRSRVELVLDRTRELQQNIGQDVGRELDVLFRTFDEIGGSARARYARS